MDLRKHAMGRYLSHEMFDKGDGAVVTVKDVLEEEVQDPDTGTSSTKPILLFNEYEQGLVLNKTNLRFFSDQYGWDSDQWIGKKAYLYHDPNIQFGSKRVSGLRFKEAAGDGTPF